jgi:hypothetical protein
MRISVLTLVSLSLSLVGCAVGSAPSWPDQVKHQYTLDIRGMAYPQTMLLAISNLQDVPSMQAYEDFRCLKFEIKSTNPYTIKYTGQVDIRECQGLTGFKANDALKVFNWADDMLEFVKDRKNCFK